MCIYNSANFPKPLRQHQRKMSTLLVLVLALAACQAQFGPANRPDLAITNVTLIDAAGGRRFRQTVIVDDGKIRDVQPTNDIPLGVNRIIDGSGKWCSAHERRSPYQHRWRSR